MRGSRHSRKGSARWFSYIYLVLGILLLVLLRKAGSLPQSKESFSVVRHTKNPNTLRDDHLENHKGRLLVAKPLPTCHDSSVECSTWFSNGECDRNPGYMYHTCPYACGGCLVSPVSHFVTLPQSNVQMPTLGFGTAGMGDKTASAVETALKMGYRRIDSAQAREWYREDAVGAGIIAWYSSGIPRQDIFITTKVHPRDFGKTTTKTAIERSLKDLRTDFIDLVLLHYAECWGTLCEGSTPEGSWRDR